MTLTALVIFGLVFLSYVYHQLRKRLEALLWSAAFQVRAYSEWSERLRVLERRAAQVVIGKVDAPAGAVSVERDEIVNDILEDGLIGLERWQLAREHYETAKANAAPQAIDARIQEEMRHPFRGAVREFGEQMRKGTGLAALQAEFERVHEENRRENLARERAAEKRTDKGARESKAEGTGAGS